MTDSQPSPQTAPKPACPLCGGEMPRSPSPRFELPLRVAGYALGAMACLSAIYWLDRGINFDPGSGRSHFDQLLEGNAGVGREAIRVQSFSLALGCLLALIPAAFLIGKPAALACKVCRHTQPAAQD